MCHLELERVEMLLEGIEIGCLTEFVAWWELEDLVEALSTIKREVCKRGTKTQDLGLSPYKHKHR